MHSLDHRNRPFVCGEYDVRSRGGPGVVGLTLAVRISRVQSSVVFAKTMRLGLARGLFDVGRFGKTVILRRLRERGNKGYGESPIQRFGTRRAVDWA